MDETSIEKKFYKLLGKLLENFVFYIPTHALYQLNATKEQFKLFDQYLNQVYVIDKFKRPTLFDIKNNTTMMRIGKLIPNRY